MQQKPSLKLQQHSLHVDRVAKMLSDLLPFVFTHLVALCWDVTCNSYHFPEACDSKVMHAGAGLLLSSTQGPFCCGHALEVVQVCPKQASLQTADCGCMYLAENCS